jgi:carboxymethylenebutenolidase
VSSDGLEDPAQREAVIERIMPLIHDLTDERIQRDGGAYLDRLEAEAAAGPVAITGYCMGGRVGWRLAADYPDRVAALGCFHTGGLVSEDDDSPHRSAAKLEAELYLGFADHDKSATPEQIATLERSLQEAGVVHRSDLFEGALHGYTMADTPVRPPSVTTPSSSLCWSARSPPERAAGSCQRKD